MSQKDFVFPIDDPSLEVFFIKGFNNGRYPHSHSMLVGNTLIDTGISNKLIRKIKKEFTIEKVILSHWHEDHILGNRFLKNVQFVCHPLDKQIIENVQLMYDYYGIRNTSAEHLFQAFMEGYKIENTHIHHEIHDRQRIKIKEALSLLVIHSPGHTAGHCCFFEETTHTLFLADIDLSRFPFYGCTDSNILDLEHSIKSLMSIPCEFAISGHKGLIEGKKNIHERFHQYLGIIHEREETILQHLSESTPTSISALMNKNIIYKKYNPAELQYEIIAEKIMIQKHLEKLISTQQVVQYLKNGYVLL
ncbi:MAG: MBL fold metallo-hydrolase [Promethearchaeota archaeon]